MSDVRTCPTCGAKAKYTVKETIETFTAVQNEDAFKKIAKLKKAMNVFKEKAEALEKVLNELKSKQ
jgi:biotin synthase-related radical SAM superfamily protein